MVKLNELDFGLLIGLTQDFPLNRWVAFLERIMFRSIGIELFFGKVCFNWFLQLNVSREVSWVLVITNIESNGGREAKRLVEARILAFLIGEVDISFCLTVDWKE